jgi:hypothetical protein
VQGLNASYNVAHVERGVLLGEEDLLNVGFNIDNLETIPIKGKISKMKAESELPKLEAVGSNEADGTSSLLLASMQNNVSIRRPSRGDEYSQDTTTSQEYEENINGCCGMNGESDVSCGEGDVESTTIPTHGDTGQQHFEK